MLYRQEHLLSDAEISSKLDVCHARSIIAAALILGRDADADELNSTRITLWLLRYRTPLLPTRTTTRRKHWLSFTAAGWRADAPQRIGCRALKSQADKI